VSEQLLTLLKLCLLLLLYLFFFRVIRAVWVEIRGPATVVPVASKRGSRRSRRATRSGAQHTLEVLEPDVLRGAVFALGDEVTIGRAGGCEVLLDDGFVSQVHARVYTSDGTILVEDLGSTNGTYLNRQRVSGPMAVKPGDQLQIGNTVLVVR
jgi:hypothetical protein